MPIGGSGQRVGASDVLAHDIIEIDHRMTEVQQRRRAMMCLKSATVGVMIVAGLLTSATGVAAQTKQETESEAAAKGTRAALKVDGLPRRGNHL